MDDSINSRPLMKDGLDERALKRLATAVELMVAGKSLGRHSFTLTE